MSPIIAGALAGGGQALERAGFEWQKSANAQDFEKMQQELLAKREVALESLRNQNQTARDVAGREHDVSMLDRREAVRREGEKYDVETIDPIKNTNAVKLATDTTQARIDVETSPANIQKAIDKLNAMAPAEAKVKRDAMIAELEAKATPAALRAAREIARATHIESAASGAAAAKSNFELGELRKVAGLRDAYVAETDPAKKKKIAENIQVMTGKDNDSYAAVPLKDETGNITGYQIFDKKSGQFVEPSNGAGGGASGGAPAVGTELNGFKFKGGNPRDKNNWEPVKAGATNPAKPAAAPAPKGIIDDARTPSQTNAGSSFSTNEQLALQEIGVPDEMAGSILAAIKTPNLNQEQSASLSLQLQKRMRELGKLGK